MECTYVTIERSKGAILIGDLNRPLQLERSSFGTKLLDLWVEGESVTLLNDRKYALGSTQ